ncbi:MAG TPA: hypothetical protein VH480_21325 [Streptosporangiaceae bacterium]|jgi:hypothetical protein
MFFLIGRRYPWLTLIIGVALVVIAAVTGSVVFALIGAVGVLLGGYRTLTFLRRRNLAGGARGGMLGGQDGGPQW